MRAGVKAWARDRGWELAFENDESSPYIEARVYGLLETRDCRFVLGPYGSDTTRALARARAGDVVWNHGAAADDVQRLPGVVSVPSPASRYLVAVARAAVGLGATHVAVVAARGRFATLAREGLEREAPALGVELVSEPGEADCVLVCGPVEWEEKLLRDWARAGRIVGGVSPGLTHASWPDGTLAPVQWHPELGGPQGVDDYVAAQAYAAALIAERCLELDPEDPLAAARSLSTETFFGPFELDETGLQTAHRLSVVRWRQGRQELLLAEAA
jgi:ABC-type branched-subunit amino acid transport system substrate-binding protein